MPQELLTGGEWRFGKDLMQELVERRLHAGKIIQSPELDLVIPALNVEAEIGNTLTAITTFAADNDVKLRILVVDNGCVDWTAEIVGHAHNRKIPVEILSCQQRGKGAAVRAGVRRAEAPYVGYCDADLSTPPASMLPGIDLLRSGWEVVIDARRCEGASYSVPQGQLRRTGSFGFRKLSSELTGPKRDTHCGFKLFHSHVAKYLFSAMTFYGFAFEAELVAKARLRQYRIIELPIRLNDSRCVSYRPLTDGSKALPDLRRSIRANRLPKVG